MSARILKLPVPRKVVVASTLPNGRVVFEHKVLRSEGLLTLPLTPTKGSRSGA
jgi:hypothetical protein